MQHPDEEILAAIALGEPDDPQLQTAREHVAQCDPCADVLADLAAVCSLTSDSLGGVRLQRPPARVWAAIESDLGAELGEWRDVDTRPEAVSELRGAMPSAPSVPAAAADDRPEPPAEVVDLARRREARSARRSPWIIGAAAAGLAVGLLGGRAVFDRSEPGPATPTVLASTVLETLDTKSPVTDARLVRDGGRIGVSIDGSGLPAAPGYLEVWLINTDGKRMVSLGVLDRRSGETFPVTQALLDEGYLVVDISREQFDDKPAHSGDSLARGSLPV